jgi:transcriptional regulator with XRE-family HTH domain
MKAMDAVKAILEEQGVTITQLANRVGKSRATIADKFTGRYESVDVNKLNEIVQAIGYDIVLIPKGSRLPQNSYKVES